MVSVISTKFLRENANKLSDRLKLLIKEKQAGKNSDIIAEQIIALVDEFSEYKSISSKQNSTLVQLFSV